MTPKVMIGYDSREKAAYDTCKYSIEKNTFSKPEIIPLVHKELRRQGWFSRPWMTNAYDGNMTDLVDGRPFSTEFSHTRFLVPSLCKYEGWALFMDCDMVFDDDIKNLFALCDDKYAAMCVKHIHRPDTGTKMDGCIQQAYPRKNWSSFVLFNNAHPANRILTPELVSTKPGGWLHAFTWLRVDQIGALPDTYNWIEGVSKANVKPSVIHFSEDAPWWNSGKDIMHSLTWWKYHNGLQESGEYEAIKETISVNYGKPA